MDEGRLDCGILRISVRGFEMNRKTLKLRRLAALLVVLSAFALPCAGWGWDDGPNGSSAPASAVIQ